MSLINNLLAVIEHSLVHLKPGLVLFCVLLPRKQADTVMIALNNSHIYYTWDTDVAQEDVFCVRPPLLLCEAIHSGFLI